MFFSIVYFLINVSVTLSAETGVEKVRRSPLLKAFQVNLETKVSENSIYTTDIKMDSDSLEIPIVVTNYCKSKDATNFKDKTLWPITDKSFKKSEKRYRPPTITSTGSTMDSDGFDEFELSDVVIKPLAKVVEDGSPIEDRQMKFVGETYDKEIHYADEYKFGDWTICGGAGHSEKCWNLAFFKTNENNFLIHGLWAQDNLNNKKHKKDMSSHVTLIANALQYSPELQELIGIWYTPIKECNEISKFVDMPYGYIAEVWVYEYFKHSVSSKLNFLSLDNLKDDEFEEIKTIATQLVFSAINGNFHKKAVTEFQKGFILKFANYIVNTKRALTLVKTSFESGNYHLMTHCKDSKAFQDCGVCMNAEMTELLPCEETSRGKY